MDWNYIQDPMKNVLSPMWRSENLGNIAAMSPMDVIQLYLKIHTTQGTVTALMFHIQPVDANASFQGAPSVSMPLEAVTSTCAPPEAIASSADPALQVVSSMVVASPPASSETVTKTVGPPLDVASSPHTSSETFVRTPVAPSDVASSSCASIETIAKPTHTPSDVGASPHPSSDTVAKSPDPPAEVAQSPSVLTPSVGSPIGGSDDESVESEDAGDDYRYLGESSPMRAVTTGTIGQDDDITVLPILKIAVGVEKAEKEDGDGKAVGAIDTEKAEQEPTKSGKKKRGRKSKKDYAQNIENGKSLHDCFV